MPSLFMVMGSTGPEPHLRDKHSTVNTTWAHWCSVAVKGKSNKRIEMSQKASSLTETSHESQSGLFLRLLIRLYFGTVSMAWQFLRSDWGFKETLICMPLTSHLILQINERRAPMVILTDDWLPSFFTVPVFRSSMRPESDQKREKVK